MKKIICLLLAVVLPALCLFGCSGEANTDDGRLSVVATIFPQYDFTRAIAGDRVALSMLVSPGSEVHGFEPTLAEMALVGECDLFLYTGGESEAWVDDMLAAIDSREVNTLRLIDAVPALREETVEGMEHNDHDEDEHDHSEDAEIDEHIWTSPKNAILMVDAICGQLCALDEANADYYRANADAYIEKLSALDRELADIVSTAKRRTVVFADRFPFRYLAEDYGLSYYAAFAGCSAATEPSLATISFLVEKIESDNIPAVFCIEFSTGTAADTISSAAGVKKLFMHSCHNLSREDFESGVGYLELMEKNAENLKEALN